MTQMEPTLADILARLERMQATIDAQQATIVALQQERMIRQSPSATSAPHALSAAPDETADDATVETPQQRPGRTSRRNLLRGAAAATAAATIGAAALGSAETAHAASSAAGDNFILGANNDAGGATTYLSSSAGVALEVAVSGSGNGGIIASTAGVGDGSAISGYSGQGTGVFAQTISGIAVHATAGSGVAIVAESSEYTAIAGTGTIGVLGTGGVGVLGNSSGGPDLKAGGSGRILQNPQSAVGAPTTTYYSAGESIRDANGELWLCTGTGSPGTWVKVLHLAPGAVSGGVVSYLSKPIRLLDTRAGTTSTSANQIPQMPCASGLPYTVNVANVTFNGVQVPAVVAGAIGNVTVVSGQGSGSYLEVVPSGAGFTGAANLAFGPGQIISNAFNAGLSGGNLDIIIGSGSVDVIVDLFAIVA